MKFEEAYKELLKGKKIKRESEKVYFKLNKEKNKIFCYFNDGMKLDSVLLNGILYSVTKNDWIVVENKSKYNPKENEIFYSIDNNGQIQQLKYNENIKCNFLKRLEINNIFETLKDAEMRLEKLKEEAKYEYEKYKEK